MRAGEVIQDRFEIDRLAGVGGMGEVFRATDRRTGERVAVKVLLDRHGPRDLRFEREAHMIADLDHPGLCRYVDHGVMSTGEQFLVMEWLEGEDLSQRLARARLTLQESVTVCARAAQALSVVHARGIVHRDLKPSNLFLIGGDVEHVKILDFGIAHLGGVSTTQSGTVLGTLGYMAPEQARTGQEIDARADVFALGCVLFECLAGTPAFAGQHLMAVLAKILFEQAPRVCELRPEVPEALDRLVARMLSKAPEARPADGAAIVAELAALGPMLPAQEEAPRSSQQAPPALGGGERRLLSVVLMGRPAGERGAGADDQELQREAAVRGGRFEQLADGTSLTTISGSTRIATDLAAQAARCAIAMRARASGRPVALTTGQAEVTGRLPVGAVIDRAARMVAAAGKERALEEASPAPIALDEVTAALLDARFAVSRGAFGLELHAELEPAEGVRTLLGKPTPCVGRDRELDMLESIMTECVETGAAQVVLVTAPPGVGKSRLLSELLRETRHRGSPIDVWLGYGDSIRAGSAFAPLAQALRSTSGIADGEPIEARREKLRARVARHVPEPQQARVAAFLGELVGAPFSPEEAPELRAARQDVLHMGEEMQRAWHEFVLAETAAHPVLLVLENLHWGDLPTVRFVDSALREARRRPLMVLGMGRPEVRDLFPHLWEERGLLEIRLTELPARASERLVREVLGPLATAETVAQIVERADGHAFYLEELIRAVAEGRGAALPETVLAMVSARLEGLEGEARRVLRAASVFGEVFWKGGVVTLLGGGFRSSQAESWLATLVEREVLVRRAGSRFPGEREYAFRHALLREGAYAMLTDADKTLGHRLAAGWLERAGEGDPMLLAEHLERGGDTARAGAYYLRAAEQANRGDDVEAAVQCAKSGLAGDVTPEVRAALLGVLCEVHGWRSRWTEGVAYADEALRLAPEGTAPWLRAVIIKFAYAMARRDLAEVDAMLALASAVEPAPDALGVYAWAVGGSIYLLDSAGQSKVADPLRKRLHAVIDPVAFAAPFARGWLHMAEAHHHAWFDEDPWHALRTAEASRDAFREARYPWGATVAQIFVGMSLWFLGALGDAERELRGAETGDRGFVTSASNRMVWLAGVLADRGELAEARAFAEQMVTTFHAHGVGPGEGRGRWALCEVLLRQGDLVAAEREVRAAIELLAPLPIDRAAATATLARVLLERQRVDEALAAASAAMEQYEALHVFGFRGTAARLVHAEALYASGDRAGAIAALGVARDRLLVTAAKIADPEYARTYLEGVPEHRRTFALLADWTGPTDGPAPPSA
jgi:tetratricopeptide (TPR) repeat protein